MWTHLLSHLTCRWSIRKPPKAAARVLKRQRRQARGPAGGRTGTGRAAEPDAEAPAGTRGTRIAQTTRKRNPTRADPKSGNETCLNPCEATPRSTGELWRASEWCSRSKVRHESKTEGRGRERHPRTPATWRAGRRPCPQGRGKSPDRINSRAACVQPHPPSADKNTHTHTHG